MVNHSRIIRNLSYSFGANLVSLSVQALMVLVMPKFMPVKEYGMWQLFLFYFSYLGFLHFGWEDGIYLRYAGKRFEELDAQVFSGQFYGIMILQLFLSLSAILCGMFFIDDPIKRVAFICAVSLALPVNFNNLCNFIMQFTNRISAYAGFIYVERTLLILFISFWIGIGYTRFLYMYLSKLGSLSIVAVLGAYLCRRLLRPCFGSIRDVLHEASLNIRVGIKLMTANIAGMLIIGIVRYGISVGWDVGTFGKVSLTLAISSFIMVFINSSSVVLFPVVKRMGSDALPACYVTIRHALSLSLLFLLLAYYPLKIIGSWWLPAYADSLKYMAILFPMCLFESKTNLLINTFLKSLRQESLMLKINAASVIVSVMITAFTVIYMHNLNAAVFSIVLLCAFRCELAEYFVERLLHIKLKREIIVELSLVGIFIICSFIYGSIYSFIGYLLTYGIYLFTHRAELKETLQLIHK